MKVPFASLSRDLFCTVPCTCSRTIRLIGYCDYYFFDVVNKEPKNDTCGCGEQFSYQWRRDGVDILFKGKATLNAAPQPPKEES